MINYISFTLILCILLYIYIYIKPASPEPFSLSKNLDNFIVYIVWNDTFNKQGLGDKLRGSIAIYQYCQTRNIQCIFDPRFSMFGKHLNLTQTQTFEPKINSSTPVSQLLNEYDDKNALEKFMNKIVSESQDKYVCVFTNVFPTIPLTLNDYMFLKSITKLIQPLEDKVTHILDLLPRHYTIQHFRFKDESEPSDNQCIKCFDLLKSNLKTSDILISNSSKFKSWVKSKIDIFTLECDESKSKSMHVGIAPSDSIIEFTLIEYNLIINAESIHTYSEYPWVSAFVSWPAKFYSIPITNTQI